MIKRGKSKVWLLQDLQRYAQANIMEITQSGRPDSDTQLLK